MSRNKARLIAAGVVGGGAAPVVGTYLTHEVYQTADDAPVTSPRTAEPGPGTYTLTDTGNKLSITPGAMAASGATTANEDPLIVGASYTHLHGRVLYGKFKGGTLRFGVANPSLMRGGVFMVSGGLRAFDYNVYTDVLGDVDSDTVYEVAVLSRDTGFLTAIKGGGFTNWTILADGLSSKFTRWVDSEILTQAVMTTVSHALATATWYEISEWKMGGLWGHNKLWTDVWQLTPANPYITNTASADMYVFATWENQVATDVIELIFRRSDANNYWVNRIVCGATMKLIKVEGGSETEISSTNIAGYDQGSGDRTCVWCNGEGIYINIGGGLGKVNTAQAFNKTATGVGVNTTGTGIAKRFGAMPIIIPSPFPGTPPATPGEAVRLSWAIGDSKCSQTWTTKLNDLVMEDNNFGFYDRPIQSTSGGGGAATIATNIATILSSRNHTPYYCLLNIGVNDLGTYGDGATWKTNMLVIIDAITTKWPGVQIYLAYPWTRGFTVEAAGLKVHINTLIASRSNCHAGHDENVWLEGGDDGATMTYDGIHYSAAGMDECAARWKTAIGL